MDVKEALAGHTNTMASSVKTRGSSLTGINGLLDLEDLCFGKIVAHLDHRSRIALFQTCTTLRNWVLSTHTVRLKFTLPLAIRDVKAAKASLRLTLTGAKSVHLVLRHSDDASTTGTWLLDPTDVDCKSLEVSLRDMQLDGLVPSWLTTWALPLTQVNHLYCDYEMPDPDIAIPTHAAGVRHVTVNNHSANCPSIAQWQHQLKALPDLQSLNFNTFSLGLGGVMECCSVIGTQLTSIESDTTGRTSPFHTLLPSWFPNLTTLHLSNHPVTDADMDVLVSMNNLQRFGCNRLELQHDHHHHPCLWTHFCIGDLQTSTLVKLHLPYLQAVALSTWTSYYSLLSLSSNPGHNVTALSLVNKCQGQLVNKCPAELDMNALFRVDVCGPGRGTHALAANVVAWMPFIAKQVMEQLFLVVDQLTEDLVTAMRMHLGATTTYIHMVSIHCGSMSMAAAQALLHSLPTSVDILQLLNPGYVDGDDDSDEDEEGSEEEHGTLVTLAQILVMCQHAARPIKIQMDARVQVHWRKDWQQRADEVMAVNGHNHVTFEVVDDIY